MKYKVKELCQIICGGTPSTINPEYWDGDIVWLTPKDLSANKNKYIVDSLSKITSKGLNNSSAKIVPKGTVLLSSRAPIGYLAISNCELCTNQGFKGLVCNKELINNEYLYYLLQTKVEELKSISTGSTFLELSTSTLKDYEIDIHNMVEQQHIVNILGSIDDKIENLENCNNKLIDYSNNLYNKYFSNSEEKILLSNIATMKSGFAFKSDWWQLTGVPVIKIANIDNSLNMEGCSFVSNDKIDLAKEFIANQGDIVFAMTGATLGKFCIVPKHDGTYLVNQRVGKFFIKNNNLPFLYCTLKTKEVFESIINLGSGSAQPNISAMDVNNLLVKYNKTLVEKFNNNLNPIFNKIINNTYTIQKINELKQLYLKKFFG